MHVETFDERHLGDAVPLFADVFSAPPWSEYWPLDEARSRIQEVRASIGGRGWVAIDDGLVGFALGYEVVTPEGQAAFLLHEMAVRRDRQCQGAGSMLLRALEHDVAAGGLECVEVLTAAGKYPCYFYEKNGYEVVRAPTAGVIVLGRAVEVTP